MKNFFLTTERLGFSTWSEEDLPDALALWGSPEVTRYIVSDGRMSEEQVYKRLKNEIDMYENYKIQYWPIYIKETGQNAGCCGLRPYDLENRIFEMGIHLKKEYWGLGIAVEACCAVIKYAFNALNAKWLFAGHNPGNIASAKLLAKLGFKYIKDEFYPPTGLFHPSYMMTRQEFNERY